MAVTQTLTPIVNKPSTSDLDNFEAEADGLFDGELPTLVTDINTVIGQINSTEANINAKEASAVNASAIAVASVNFRGVWNSTLNIIAGDSVVHNGVFYRALLNSTNQTPPTSATNYQNTYWAGYGSTLDYIITQLALKSNLASPTFTGTPTAPTPAIGTNNAQITNTAFVYSTKGNLQAQGVISSSATLTQNSAGSLLLITGSSLTITLPAINTILSGSLFRLKNASTTTATIATNGNSHDLVRLTILPGETLTIQSDGASFYRFINRSKDRSGSLDLYGMPNYPAGSTRSAGATYTETTNGILIFSYTEGTDSIYTIILGGVTFQFGTFTGSNAKRITKFDVPAGVSYTLSNISGVFYPSL